MTAGNVFQQFYTFADTMVVGRVLGMDALAALGAAEWIVFLMFGSMQGLVQGFSIIVAQRFGRKERKAENITGVTTAFLMSAFMFFFGRPVLFCFLAGEAVAVGPAAAAGYRFLLVLSCFFPFLYLLYIIRACVQGMGNSLYPMLSGIEQLVMRCACALLLTRWIGETGIFYGEILAWLGADAILVCGYYDSRKKYEFQPVA